MKGDPLNAIVQIRAKPPCAHLVVERSQRGENQADIGLQLRRAPHAHVPPVLEKAQHLGLRRERHFADLVEK